MQGNGDNDHTPSEPATCAPGTPRTGQFNAEAFERAVTDLLRACGVEPEGAHTGKTPRRVRELWEKRLLGGYAPDPAEVLGPGFADPRQDMVVERGIAVHGVCPHHLVPFRGTAHVACVPGGRLHGFGRIARLVDAMGHRLTYQEWMTRAIVDALVQHGHALGAACVVEAEQLCLLLGEDRRGDERVYTQAFAGCFNTDAQLRSEFMRAIGPAGS
jgi:GTP cyclohydrolase IA